MAEDAEREGSDAGEQPSTSSSANGDTTAIERASSTRERLRALSPRYRNLMLATVAVVLLAFAWHVRSVLNPLIAAYFLAFVLHPLVMWLQNYGWTRKRAVNTIFVIAILLLGSVGLGIGGQALHYSRTVSDEAWIDAQIEKADRFLVRHKERVVQFRELVGYPIMDPGTGTAGDSTAPNTADEPGIGAGPWSAESGGSPGAAVDNPPYISDEDVGIRSLVEDIRAALAEPAPGGGGSSSLSGTSSNVDFAISLFGSVMALLGFLVLLPIYTYFLLFELERIHSFVRRYIPKSQRERVTAVGGQIGEVIGSFFRGRLTICLAKGLFIAAGLGVFGIDYALLLGMGAGALSLIPFAGPLLSFVAAFILALQQPASASKEGFDLLAALWRTGLVFGLAELFEGYYLTPKILGESLGLHPVVVLVSIFAGGAAFGMFGILLALPVTAALVILFRVFVLPAMERLADE